MTRVLVVLIALVMGWACGENGDSAIRSDERLEPPKDGPALLPPGRTEADGSDGAPGERQPPVPVVLSVNATAVPATDQTATVCVVLDSGGNEVAGTQNDLFWDSGCATPLGACVASGQHDKSLMAAPRGGSAVRAIVISFNSLRPIPDGDLYCCSFQVELQPDECCPLGIDGVGASDPSGRELDSVATGGEICRQ